jgi:signal transduction histidine kinase
MPARLRGTYRVLVVLVPSRLRLPRPDPVLIDRVLAVAVFVVAVAQIAVWDASSWWRWSGVVEALLLSLGLAYRRRWPTLVGIGTPVVLVLREHVATVQSGPGLPTALLPWLCALYALGVWTSRTWFLIGLAVYLVIDLVPWPGFDSSAFGFTVLTSFGMVMVRVVVGGRDRALRLAERERLVAAREAVVEERARIARELHDVVAHHVSTMVLQAGAERRAVGSEETRDVLAGIEQVGRSALREMRRMVEMLRQDGPDELAPQPRLGEVALLVDQLRSAGMDVSMSVDGIPRDLPEGIELSAYRIVQEALTNALKHAGGAGTRVRIGYGTEALELEIVDAGGTTSEPAQLSGGHGLVGMRERVAMYGGTFEAGRVHGGGFGVRVLLPVQ